MLSLSVRALHALTLAGAIAGCDAQGSTQAAAAFDAERAWKHLEAQVAFGPRPAGSEALERTRGYLESELRALGLEPKRETFECPEAPYAPLTVTNVVADVVAPGADATKLPIVLLGTHYDTKRLGFPFVGANDGGSGTAVLLELARLLAAEPSPRVVWRLVFLDGEEAIRFDWLDPDNRYGSRHYAKALTARGETKRIKAFVLLDMVGDADLVLTRDTYSDPRLYAIVRASAKALSLEKHLGTEGMLVKDDHLSFIAEGIPSLDLIDFDYGPQNSFWHTKEDTLGRCSRASLAAIGRLVAASLNGFEAFATR